MTEPHTLPAEVPRDLEYGEKWRAKGLCVICGQRKTKDDEYHCGVCYTRIYPSIFDYDDD